MINFNKKFKENNILNFNSNNLNTRMKLYEDYTEHYVSKVGEEPFVVRLKGRNFKNIKANDRLAPGPAAEIFPFLLQ